MPTNVSLRQAIKDIAYSIRQKGVTGTMSLNQMPAKVASIPSGGQPRYGLTMDSLIGDVDANGVLQLPSASFSFSSQEMTESPADYSLEYKFQRSAITSVSLPNLASAGNYGLYGVCFICTSLTTVDLSSLSSVGNYGLNSAFWGCTSLRTVYLSSLSSVGTGGLNSAFKECKSLELVDFSQATAVPELSNVDAFQSTNLTYKIVVPDALYNGWRTATNWSNSSIVGHIVKASQYTT